MLNFAIFSIFLELFTIVIYDVEKPLSILNIKKFIFFFFQAHVELCYKRFRPFYLHLFLGEHLPSNYVGKILDGFTLASAPLHARKVYSLPVIPKDYKPFHVFKEISCDLKPLVPDQKNQQLNAHSRSILLGEISTEGKLYMLINICVV